MINFFFSLSISVIIFPQYAKDEICEENCFFLSNVSGSEGFGRVLSNSATFK